MAKKSNKNFITVPTGAEMGQRVLKGTVRGAGAITGVMVANNVPKVVKFIPRRYAAAVPFFGGLAIETLVNEDHDVGQYVCVFGQGMTAIGAVDGVQQNVNPSTQQKFGLAGVSNPYEIQGSSSYDSFPYDPVRFDEMARDAEEAEILSSSNEFAPVN
ncbi:MAG: hypothetical protein AAFV78_14775 [Bacteroidota bacterium]